MKLKHLGIFGIISLISYTSMVVFSPLAYPGYNSLTMAVSDLSAVVSVMAVYVKNARKNKLFLCFLPCLTQKSEILRCKAVLK